MYTRIVFFLLWIVFVVYAFFLAPPNSPDTLDLITNLSFAKWDGINPLVVSLFNLMGVWPIIYACVLIIDGRNQKIPAWPFSLASFAVGAFAILPYLALRHPNPDFQGDKNLLIKLLDSRITGVFLLIGASVLSWFGLSKGDWSSFVAQWSQSRFINVMSLDFCLLSLLFPTLVIDDLSRRKAESMKSLLFVSFIPLLGPLLYLCLRTRLPITNI